MSAATNFTFLFSPHYHPAMKRSHGARRVGVRTIFNTWARWRILRAAAASDRAFSLEAGALMPTRSRLDIERAFVS